MQKNIKTTMTGKEYLAYCKYKDSRRKESNKEIGKHLKQFGWHYVVLGVCCAAFITLYNLATYTEPYVPSLEQKALTVLLFLGFALGLSWIIHGVGFVLVKR